MEAGPARAERGQRRMTGAGPAAPGRPQVAWHSLPLEEVFARTASGPEGLAPEEARRRLAELGPNELAQAVAVRPWQLLAGQFKSLLVWILIAATFITGLLGEWVDSIAIFAIVVLNAGIGFYQELSAEKSIAALQQMTAPLARVRRAGRLATVAASAIVPGDVVELEAGDLVPADARLIDAASLRSAEAALTGESEPVEKRAATLSHANLPLGDRANLVYMGTSIAAGQGCAVVVATGMDAEIGRIAQLLEEAGAAEQTPLQARLAAFGRVLVWSCLGVVALLFALGLARGADFAEMFLTSVSLAVAAVPEGLPAVVTVALALGVVRMSRRRALVRRLPAVETLGSTNVICSDKTGTLTLGEMTVRELYIAGESFAVSGEGYGPEGGVRFEGEPAEAGRAAALRALGDVLVGCNKAQLVLEDGRWQVVGDPTEGALLAAGRKAGSRAERLETDWPRRHEIPFDSERKRRAIVRALPGGGLRAFVNGAPELLLERCTRLHTAQGVRAIEASDRDAIAEKNAEMASRGLRVLGSATRDLEPAAASELTAERVERELVFVGLSGMHDPPRPEAKEAVARCRSAGIRVVMITGDHPRTALAIARALGIAGPEDVALAGPELDALEDAELRRRAPQVAVYARVTAQHKLRIVRAWQAHGAVVAMTGDGVNDAPAIKGADIGVAMGRSGTEVTKQAADIVIADDDFASIVAAVEEGRGIYANIQKTLQYLLAGNCGELLLMTGCILAGLPVPLLAIHLLWINLVTDGLPALCLATDPIDADLMKRPPRARSEGVVDRGFLARMFLTGGLTAAVSLAVFAFELQRGSLATARNAAFSTLVFAELLRAFGARSENKLVSEVGLLSNLRLLGVVGASFALQLASHHSALLGRLFGTQPISLGQCLAWVGLGSLPLIVLEVRKWAQRRGSLDAAQTPRPEVPR